MLGSKNSARRGLPFPRNALHRIAPGATAGRFTVSRALQRSFTTVSLTDQQPPYWSALVRPMAVSMWTKSSALAGVAKVANRINLIANFTPFFDRLCRTNYTTIFARLALHFRVTDRPPFRKLNCARVIRRHDPYPARLPIEKMMTTYQIGGNVNPKKVAELVIFNES